MFQFNAMPTQISEVLRKSLLTVQTSTLGHLRDNGFIQGLTPNQRPIQFAGTAVTVRLPHMDSTALHVAADQLRPGDVLVVDQSGDDRSSFGGMVAFTSKSRGAEGVILAGAMNDFEEVLELGLPVYSRGVSARTTRILGIEGAINVPITIGGVVVTPGDAVFADSDGIAVLRENEIEAVVADLQSKEGAEPSKKLEIAAGARLSEWSGAAKYFETTGASL
ncbi:RraA family protein [Leucobacter insecticola]|uniref:Putative 4-hydroxy-4-methyl-2-oxoglutarate aldolase n=1 Tax=Leucobacter insecticola TaxID=2714934 RepID=A0A6G8FKS5_9MICO|nr:RraA family protein [Leucobacter insecticola]QIM16954.1 RraA family protein [Leucobacter insecticola]